MAKSVDTGGLFGEPYARYRILFVLVIPTRLSYNHVPVGALLSGRGTLSFDTLQHEAWYMQENRDAYVCGDCALLFEDPSPLS